jgi:hypothetical protein
MKIPQPTDLDFLLKIEDRPAATELRQLSDLIQISLTPASSASHSKEN